MRGAWNHFQCGSLDQPGRENSRSTDRYDLVIVSVKNQGRYVELFEIFREVRFGEGFDTIESSFVPGHHPLKPERVPQALRDLGARPVGAIERRTEILKKLRAVVADSSADLVERVHRQSAGIGGRLQHQ